MKSGWSQKYSSFLNRPWGAAEMEAGSIIIDPESWVMDDSNLYGRPVVPKAFEPLLENTLTLYHAQETPLTKLMCSSKRYYEG